LRIGKAGDQWRLRLSTAPLGDHVLMARDAPAALLGAS
jgi:hypothetical protein